MYSIKLTKIFCFFAVLTSIANISVHAATIEWINSLGGSFNDGANWQGGSTPGPGDATTMPPTPADDALFNLSSTYTVTFPLAPTPFGSTFIQNDNVTFDLNMLNLNLGEILVGDFFSNPSSTLTLQNGELTLPNLTIATDINSATLNVSTNSILNSDIIFFGSGPTGTLNINNGGILNGNVSRNISAGTELGTINVNGSGSQLNGSIDLGLIGSTSLNATNGASISSTDINIRGDGTSTVFIDGIDTTINTDTFEFRGSAIALQNGAELTTRTFQSNPTNSANILISDAALDITESLFINARNNVDVVNNGTISTATAVIGNTVSNDVSLNPIVTIDGIGSSLNVSDSLFIGGFFNGAELRIINGASVMSNSASIGASCFSCPDSISVIDLSGNNSTFNVATDLTLGQSGNPGTLIMSDNADTSVAGAIEIINGEVNVNGGNLNTNSLNLMTAGTVNLSAGSLMANSIDATSGNFNVTGGTLGFSIFEGDLINQGATVQALGDATLTGSYTQNSGSLLFEISSGNPSGISALTTTGDINLLNGSVIFSFIDGFLPSEGFTFEFLNAGGAFDINSAILFSVIGIAEGFEFDTDIIGNSINFIALNDASAVPLPATAWLFMSALLIIFGFARQTRD